MQAADKDRLIEAYKQELNRINELYGEACKALGEAQVGARLNNSTILRLQEEIQELQHQHPPEESPVLEPEPGPSANGSVPAPLSSRRT